MDTWTAPPTDTGTNTARAVGNSVQVFGQPGTSFAGQWATIGHVDTIGRVPAASAIAVAIAAAETRGFDRGYAAAAEVAPASRVWPTLTMSRHAAPITTAALDRAMSRYLPASPASLRAVLIERTGETAPDAYTECDTVTELLVMLADLDSNTDNSPTRAY